MLLSVKSCCCAFLVFSFLPLQASLPGGLKFHGSEQPINKRTSYNVFGDKVVRFSDRFDIDFKLSLYPTTKFGYIMRIKNSESKRIYNLFYDGQGDHLTFRFNEEGTHNLIVVDVNQEELLNLDWFKMNISFDLKSDSIHLTIANNTYSVGNEALPDTYAPIILFGKSDHIIDVPSFAIKDLAIGQSEKYFFALKESEGNVVHEVNDRATGKVSNPEWLVNDAYHWRHKVSYKSRSVAGANYNPERKEIYYFNADSLITYNVRSGDTRISVFEEKCPVKLILGTNFLDTKRHKLYSYELYYSTPNDDYNGPTIASLDLDTYQWTPENDDQLSSPLHHHGAFLDLSGDHYTLFGGFGNMHYSKTFYSYDTKEKEWSTLDGFTGDVITPRYFSSVGYLKDANAMYIFGGMGNESGEQVVGRKYYYDLYKVDLNTKHISKLWEIKWDHDNVVPVRGMVILNDSSFYTLCYPEHFSKSFLKLYQFSLKDGSYKILGDSIPIYSDKITTNANLYFDSGLNTLYAVVQEFDDDISSDLKVYSLAFPPITAQELESYAQRNDDNTLAIVLLSFFLASGFGYLIFRKVKSRPGPERSGVEHVPVQDDKSEVTRPNVVYLFGAFTVRDRNDRDITYMFSSQLTQIFCLILQYSTVDEGIASQRLSSILWPDRPADKAKNSRGVTINHLRKVLSELDGIELIYEKGHFKIVQSEGFYCDYSRCMELISRNEIDAHREEFLRIVARGKFLQLFDHSLFDSFKEETEKILEPVLLQEMEKRFAAEDYQATITLADAVFNIDPLHDAAISFQIKAMQRLRLTDEAKARYKAFVLEYKKIMENDYPHTLKV